MFGKDRANMLFKVFGDLVFGGLRRRLGSLLGVDVNRRKQRQREHYDCSNPKRSVQRQTAQENAR
jgi:hypothetical protein